MGVYIEGIKLPKDEPGAFQVIVMYVGADGKLRAECEGTHEIVPVPPHGRLIDADALYSHIKDEQRKCNDPYEGWSECSECQVALGFVNTASTIIPAEEAQP